MGASKNFNYSIYKIGKISDGPMSNVLQPILIFIYFPGDFKVTLLSQSSSSILSLMTLGCYIKPVELSKNKAPWFFLSFFFFCFKCSFIHFFPINISKCGFWKITRLVPVPCHSLSLSSLLTANSFVCTIFFYSEQYNILVLVINAFMWSSSAKRMLLDRAPRQCTSTRSIQSWASAHSLFA